MINFSTIAKRRRLKVIKDDEDDDIEIIKAVTAGEANSRADDQLPPS